MWVAMQNMVKMAPRSLLNVPLDEMIMANLNLENAQTWGNLELTLQVGLSEVPYLYGKAYLGEAANTLGDTGELL